MPVQSHQYKHYINFRSISPETISETSSFIVTGNVLVSLLLTLNIVHTFLLPFNCWQVFGE